MAWVSRFGTEARLSEMSSWGYLKSWVAESEGRIEEEALMKQIPYSNNYFESRDDLTQEDVYRMGLIIP